MIVSLFLWEILSLNLKNVKIIYHFYSYHLFIILTNYLVQKNEVFVSFFNKKVDY